MELTTEINHLWDFVDKVILNSHSICGSKFGVEKFHYTSTWRWTTNECDVCQDCIDVLPSLH